jgi:hypothetical protein
MGGNVVGTARIRNAASASEIITRTGAGICVGPKIGVSIVAAATRAASNSVPMTHIMSICSVIGS